jgi:hypothetical protein
LGTRWLVAERDAASAGEPDPDVVAACAEGPINLLVGDVGELLKAFVPVVG